MTDRLIQTLWTQFLALFLALLGASSALAQTTYEDILNASKNPENWVTYSGQYTSQRFSRLDQVTRKNAKNLELKWVRQFNTLNFMETSPIVVDGIMYVTQANNIVHALDAHTGLPFWTYTYPLPQRLTLCCLRQNRGVAILGDRLFMGTLDAHLVALDSKTGTPLWNVEVADRLGGYSITGAPLVVKDMVIIGVSGGEYGIRGFIDAYDAATGERRWRRYTIPSEGEPGNETWEGDSWKTGGAPAWMTGSFDPELNLLYMGTGNPGPDWNGEVREGDNLYSDSLLALDVDTGELKWHFQFTPHDVHDWDSCQVPVLVDMEFGGRPRKLVLFGNRNAFYYTLDRVTGEFLVGKPFAKQTWAEGLDKKGRPIRLPNTFPSEQGTVVSPHVQGGANWWSPSYSPQTELFYLMAFDASSKFYVGEAEYGEGELFVGSFPEISAPDDSFVSAVRAIDPRTGDRVWEHQVYARSTSGILSTAGGIVFGGTKQGNFFALDDKTGNELWRRSTGGNIHAAPVTYAVGGKQWVSIASGHAIFTFGLAEK
jgi:alcohol dehydrogenase (cytochrome c)